MIAVRRLLDSSVCKEGMVDILEQVFVTVRLAHINLHICAFYLPYEKRLEHNLLEKHINSVTTVCELARSEDIIIAAGDYNQSYLVWRDDGRGYATADLAETHARLRTERASHETLLDGMAICNLRQIQTVRNANNRILDLIFISDDESLPTVHCVEDPLVPLDSHHPAVWFEIEAVQRVAFQDDFDPNSLNYRRTDFATMCTNLAAVDWSPVLTCTNVNDAVTQFGIIVRLHLQRLTPRRRPPRKPPWSDAHLKWLKKIRSAALRQYSHDHCTICRRRYKKACSTYKRYNKLRYRQYVHKTQCDLKRNPKKFWSFVKTKYKENGLPSSMVYGSRVASNSEEKCTLFAEHFASVFNKPDVQNDIDPACLDAVPSNLVSVDTFDVTGSMLRKTIAKLKSSFVAGPDGIPAAVIKRCGSMLEVPLLKIFNMSMTEATFPEEWKKSYMFPVFKKGEKRRVENYRGITSLCSCSKVLELIMCDYLMFNCRNYITFEQHGFVAGRSVTTNLMEFVTTCFNSMSEGLQVDAVYTDLKAAFDRIDHDIALMKFAKLGFSSRICSWLESYLKGRRLQVKIGSSLSVEFSNWSGVPQGSNLGPIGFALFYNDAGLSLHGNCKLIYADDLKLFTTIESLADCYVLQSHIDAFAEWCRLNRMTLSIEKCMVISFHRKTKRHVFTFDYTLLNQPIQRVDCVKDLGALLDFNLTFRQQQASVIEKANRQLGFMFRATREFDDPACLRTLYYALVRSHLETSCIIWAPYHQNWIDRIERIQRKFVWFAARNFNWRDPSNLPPYEHRCELLGLMTLENRRKLSKAMFAAKLLTGELDCPNLLEQLGAAVQARSLRTRSGFLHRTLSTTEYMRHSPFRSMCSTFNDFFDLFEFGESTTSFRTKLTSRLSIRGRRDNAGENERPRRSTR